MKRLLMGLAVLPFIAGVAGAAQPLTNQQMDRVTAGFFANSQADALGLAGAGGEVLTATLSLAGIGAIASANVGEITVTAYKSVSTSGSSSVTVTSPTLSLGN
jgi:hypothetical protein